uniref:Uncharacterized protein n=1 Tax=Craspedostauros australis TaxID=1486917 RepID=A0A7R9WP02_9STRA|mmetsp:Transcript_13897/g.38194  ORF Transcript_13897/g.38194 Transcript_13897/m.38194 type:complete len:207 (+) Transcript_13897:342-962(+)|eukprot:CAMPEP_0198115174 /NCGR_PEP_ID=MMETSP1442-20131203/6359_1 /TAXON_ID= /ORGANISM="Craspedostauros australis, Strain CCMP3328" /LENGTH=206 /DNA_ID=CAMNT_0043772631 /DNA_START=101 /DNA_END=721 /DNA_ORIENTATION=-
METLSNLVENVMASTIQTRNLRSRRTEDVDYWRKRAGWFDDDVAMKDYNEGVYDKYYDADGVSTGKSGGSGSSGEDSGGMFSFLGESKGFNTFMKIGAVIIALLIAIVVYRAMMRRPTSSKSRKKSSSDSKSRSRSKSASRSRSSRSRSRSRRTGNTSNYDIIDDVKSDSKSRKSGRSRSRSRRARSSRSRSKPRPQPKVTKEVLV